MHYLKRSDEKVDILSADIDFGGEASLPPPPILTPEEENKLWGRIDRRITPMISLMYMVAPPDRGELHEFLEMSIYLIAVCLQEIWVRLFISICDGTPSQCYLANPGGPMQGLDLSGNRYNVALVSEAVLHPANF